MRAKIAGLATAALLLGAVPVAAEEVAETAETAPLTTYFHCSGNIRAQNALLTQEAPSWDTTAPAQSVEDGAGCGFADPSTHTGTNQENVYDGVFKGSFAGNLDSLTVRLYDMGVNAARTGADQELGIRLTVDGKSMFDTHTPAPSPLNEVVGPPVPVPSTKNVTVTPSQANSGATGYVEFTVTGLGFMEELGTGTMERQVLLTVHNLSPGASAWVMDTVEVPSGITFNAPTPAAATVAATTPGPEVEEDW